MYGSDKIVLDPCLNHSARNYKENTRVCPSKLSKHELEDLYFSIVDTNISLKRTINSQQENIKQLSTKLQRMTASQRNVFSKDSKQCCSNAKAVIEQQRESINDLKKSNECLSERIRLLNMKLCSAKQFMKKAPLSLTKNGSPTYFKNVSTTALNGKNSSRNTKCVSANTQYDSNDILSIIVKEDLDNADESSSEKECNDNRCTTLTNELKDRVVLLERELTLTQSSYSDKVSRLENDMEALRIEKQKVLRENFKKQELLEKKSVDLNLVRTIARDVEAKCCELSTQLSIETKKVAELETRLKAVHMSNDVTKTVEQYLSHKEVFTPVKSLSRTNDSKNLSLSPPKASSSPVKDGSASSDLHGTQDKAVLLSDDSGYTDQNNVKSLDTRRSSLSKIDSELLKTLANLQAQLDSYKMSSIKKKLGESENANNDPSKVKERDVSAPKNVDTCNDSNAITDEIKERQTKDTDRRETDKYANENTDVGSENIDKGTEILFKQSKALKKGTSLTKDNSGLISDDKQSYNKVIESKLTDEQENDLRVVKNSNDITNVENLDLNVTNGESQPQTLNSTQPKKSSTKHKRNYKDSNINDNMDNYNRSTTVLNDSRLNFDTQRNHANVKISKENRVKSARKKIGKSNTYEVPSTAAQVLDAMIEGPSNDLRRRSVDHILRNLQKFRMNTFEKVDKSADSPGLDTDKDVSSMTDLPSERETTSTSAPSPGERLLLPTSTFMYDSLSEGEVPVDTDLEVSDRTKRRDSRTNSGNASQYTSSQRMEMALKSIGEEMARCKMLLTMKKPQEVNL